MRALITAISSTDSAVTSHKIAVDDLITEIIGTFVLVLVAGAIFSKAVATSGLAAKAA